MAADTIVTGSKLTAIANAIRSRTGGSSQLTLDDMPSEIAGIGSNTLSKVGQDVLTNKAGNNGTPAVATRYGIAASDFGPCDGVNTMIRDHAFADEGVYRGRVTSVEIPSWVTHVGKYAFQQAVSNGMLSDVTFDGDATDDPITLASYAFAGNNFLTSLVCPRRVVDGGGQSMVMNDSSLTLVDLALTRSNVYNYVVLTSSLLGSAYNIRTVILRHRASYGGTYVSIPYGIFSSNITSLQSLVLDTDAMVQLGSSTQGSLIPSGCTTTIYVTDSLKAAYEADTRWMTLLSAANVTLDKLSNYDPS